VAPLLCQRLQRFEFKCRSCFFIRLFVLPLSLINSPPVNVITKQLATGKIEHN